MKRIKEVVKKMLDNHPTLKIWYIDLKRWVVNLYYNIMENKGKVICLCCLILCLLGPLHPLDYALLASILYAAILCRELVDHKKEKDILDSVDIHYFETANKNLEDPLDGYIDACINEYMILYRGLNNNAYINDKEEQNIRKGVLDIVASNFGPLMKKKFEMYYGHGQVTNILAKKCFIRISLYVANVNKALYMEGGEKEQKEIDKVFKQAMMDLGDMTQNNYI